MTRTSVIKQFKVSALFGIHDYDLTFDRSIDGSKDQETLLYGDNGSGKTTILKLMYHLLAKRAGEGARTFLSRAPLKSLYLELSGGQAVEYVKSRNEQFLTYSDGRSATRIALTAEEDGSIQQQRNPDHLGYIEFLTNLKIEQLYLSDERKILTSYRGFNLRPSGAVEKEMVMRGGRLQPGLENIDLYALGERVKDIVRDKLFDSSVFAQSNVNGVYLDLARRLGSSAKINKRRATDRMAEFEARVKRLSSEYAVAAGLEIFPAVNFDEFVGVVKESGTRQANAMEVIETYLDTVEVRVGAVREVARLLREFIDEVNSYLVNKRLAFSIRRGFEVLSSRRSLSFKELSSGERQLLFLMFISFVTRDDKSIVYIDEPELSLNIKWQRKLISSILKVVEGTETQLIAATHSFEILAKHRRSIIDLNKVRFHGR